MIRNISLTIAGSILLAISSKISIPFYPVPITIQNFVLLAMAMAFRLAFGIGNHSALFI